MGTNNLWQRGRTIWQRLVSPAVTIQEDAQRQQARLLAGLSLALLFVGFIVVIIWVWANPNFTAAPYISIGIISSLIATYLLSRSRHFRLGINLFMAVILLTVGTIIITAPGPMTERMLVLYYLAIAILLASLLLSLRTTLLIVALSLVATALFFFVPGVPFAVTYSSLVFMVIISALLILAHLMRNSYLTERKEAEEKLREQEQYLRVLFAQTPIGIMTVDMAGNVTDANPRSLEILGSPGPFATIGLNMLTLPPLVAAGISPILAQALANGEKAEIETWYSSIWDKRLYLFIRAVPHFDGQGQQIGLIILVEELTQRIQAEEGMRQMQKLESLSVLAGGIAHDFNNLLVAMLGQTSLALAKCRPESPSRPHVEKAVTAAEQAALLTQQLLAYSGHGRFQVAPLDLNTLIEENLHLFAATIPKQIHLRTKLADSLPFVEVDVAQFQQVVMNLLINAAEALGNKRGTITIVTETQRVAAEDSKYWQYTTKPLAAGTYVTMEVHDNGPGMTPETLANMFDPFFTTKEKGHGLGLAAVLGIIKGHKGGLSVHSEVDKGTTIKVLLPANHEREIVQTAEPAEPSHHRASGLVLVIDDEPHVREAVADILSLEDIEVLTAADGQSGLALYQAHQADIALVLLDLSMPGWSGEQTMRELRKTDPEIRIILSSGYNEIEATQRFAGKGLAGFLQKPYSADELLQTVRAHQDS